MPGLHLDKLKIGVPDAQRAARVLSMCALALALPTQAQDTATAPANELVVDMREPAEPAPTTTPVESPVIQDFTAAIAAIERQEGTYGPGLSEQLLGLGIALQQQARHEQAIDAFKRAAHLARINTGLYSREQIELLRRQIESQLALKEYEAVDQRQQYLYRVERRALRDQRDSPYALLRHAEWQRLAYQEQVGDEDTVPLRLQQMWNLYRLSLTEMIDHFGEASPELRKPLVGMLQAQYLFAGHQQFASSQRKNTADSPYGPLSNYTFRKGEKVLKALIELGLIQSDLIAVTTDKLALADWAWWFGKRKDAQRYYDDVHAFALESDDAVVQAYLQSTLAEPIALPTEDDLQPLPPPMWDDSGVLVVSFTISETGRVSNLERLAEPEVEEYEGGMNRLLRVLRRTRFRPPFEEGRPVASEPITWSWQAAAWRPQASVE